MNYIDFVPLKPRPPWYERRKPTQDPDELIKRLQLWKRNRSNHDGLGVSLLDLVIQYIDEHR